jgi:hypothetical protein
VAVKLEPPRGGRNEPSATLATAWRALEGTPRGPARKRGVGTLATGDQHRVERAWPRQRLGLERDARGADGAPRAGGDHPQLVTARAQPRGDLKRCDRAGGIEQLEVRKDQKTDATHAVAASLVGGK